MKEAMHKKAYPYSRESLRELDPETIIDMFLSLDAKYQQLGEYVRELVSDKYGPKTEKFSSPGQLLMFPESEQSKLNANSDFAKLFSRDSSPIESQSSSAPGTKPGHSRKSLPEHLPKVPIIASANVEDLLCGSCGNERVAVNQILQNSRLQFVPASFYVEELYSVVYQCAQCDCKERLQVKVPETVRNGIAAPGLLSQIAVARDIDHIPFNRQSAIYSRSGVALHRSTICDLYAHLARTLKPLHTFMHEILLQSKIISTDDTPVKVLDRTTSRNIKTGHKWIYMGDKEHPVNVFDYTFSRGRDGPLTFLQGYMGRIQGDCFSGNLSVCASMGTVLVACLAHARRYFIKSLMNDKRGSNHALLMFQALYEIERAAKELDLPRDDIQTMRQQEAIPLLEDFHIWLKEQYALAQPKSSFGKALFYCLNNWNELMQYATDGDFAIDNNLAEQQMKYVAMGKKAWLFFGSDAGGQNHAIVASVLSTCRRHGVEPWSYLTDIIQRLTENPHTNLEDLLPYNWKQTFSLIPSAEIKPFLATPKVA